MPPLSVCDTSISIRNDLYSLNDLHKAAGADEKYRPTFFLRNEQAQALIAELDKCADSHISKCADVRISHEVVRGGKGGTFVCRELVYAYAMWISPKFNLAVIRAFDHLATSGNMAPPAPAALPEPEAGHISIPLDDWFEICNVIHTVGKAHTEALSHRISHQYAAAPSHLPIPYNIGARAGRAMGMIHGLTFQRLRGK